MHIAGFVVEDTVGTGVEGPVPLTGLTLLFGRNATGKTLILESLASILDPKLRWLGRRPRFDESPYAYATLLLSGDWDGKDWAWLRSVMLSQNQESLEASTSPVVQSPSFAAPSSRRRVLLDAVQEWDVSLPGDDAGALFGLLERLTSTMLVSYLPFAAGTVDAVIDTTTLDDETRAVALKFSHLLGDAPLGHRLADVAASPQRYVDLFGFGSLDDGNFEELELHPPSTINVSASTWDAEAVVSAALAASRTVFIQDEEDWLEPSGDGRYNTNRQVTTAAAALQHVLERGPIPAFVLEQGMPEIHIPTPELWAQHGRVMLGLRTASGRFLDIRQSSAAVARWVNVLVMLAVDTWLHDQLHPSQALNWDAGLPVVHTADRVVDGRVLVFDEPELHLHPVAQAQVADWLVNMQGSGTTVVAGTHSPQIINAYSAEVTLVGTDRSEGKTRLEDLTPAALRHLDEAASVLGADRAAWLQVTRGIVLVEGEHDVAVVNRFVGPHLQRLRVAVIPIRGHKNLAGTVISEFFGRMGVPVRVMLDDVRALAVLGDPSVKLASSEERMVGQLIHQRGSFPNLDVVAYEDPDILCALPMEAVRRVWPDARPLDWSDITASWRTRTDHTGFKPYALKRLGIKSDTDNFLRKTLASIVPGDEPSEAFRKAMNELLVSLT